MSKNESIEHLIVLLTEAGVEFIVVGGIAGILQGAPILTRDLDIVHRSTPENIRRLLGVLAKVDACFRPDPGNRRLKPTAEALAGHGHLTLQTSHGPLDVLCELEEGQTYEALLPDTEILEEGATRIRVLTLPALIAVKIRTGRPKDRMLVPILVATLEERRKKG